MGDMGAAACDTGGLRIGELARHSGVAARTIRFYEQEGLLPLALRTANGYRLYGSEAVERLRFVRGARLLGLSLAEVRAVLDVQERGEAPCQHVVRLLAARDDDIQERIEALQALQETLRAIRLRATTLPEDVQMQGCVCHLIGQQAAPVSSEMG